MKLTGIGLILMLGVLGAGSLQGGTAYGQSNPGQTSPGQTSPGPVSPAQTSNPPPAQRMGPTAARAAGQRAVETLNAWTVGLAGGQLEGAPIRFATEIARVVDDGDNLHVLPIVTRGPAENIEDLLYLRGVDVAIINTDAL